MQHKVPHLGKVVIIDDDQDTLNVIERKLSHRGVQVVCCLGGENYESYLDHTEATVILLDIIMPQVSGLEVLQKIRSKWSRNEIPVIMLTSQAEDHDVISALSLGANDYLTKPMNVDIAIARIKTQLEMTNYYKECLKKSEIESLNALIVTYHHEINNPLTIALMALERIEGGENQSPVATVQDALSRIADVVKRIGLVTHSMVTYEAYSSTTKMVKIK